VKRSLRYVIALPAALALAVTAACGSSSTASDTGSAPQSSAGGSSTGGATSDTSPSGGGSSSQDVRTINVATSSASKPLSWENSKGKIQGYEPAVLNAIANKLKDKYKFNTVAVEDNAGQTGIATGKYDLLAGGLYKTPERAKQFLIPDEPDGLSLTKIYVRKDSDIKNMKDLVGKKIVPVSAGGGMFNFVTDWNKNNPDHKITFKTSSAGIAYPERLKEVASGQYDALILPSNLGENKVIKDQNLPIKTTEPVKITKTYFLIHKSDKNEQLAKDVSSALKSLMKDGTLSKFSKKWYGENTLKYMDKAS
jgi:L-cystine transport system substrate-binding protein